ncbi:MAG TPA: hypothetical protein VFW71_10645 [Actinomycetota bacterium]|nr:hypothetical protein [Actinomycetota bacterium]
MERMQLMLLVLWSRVTAVWDDPEGFTTAELLGNAALAIAALVAIWGVLRIMGLNIVTMITNKLNAF